MAPSFDIGKPQRSLVRIPESGRDKHLKPICLDIAQITNFSKSLVEIMKFNFGLPPEPAIVGTISVTQPPQASSTQSPSSSEGTRNPRKRTHEEGPERANKRSTPSPASLMEENAALSHKERLEKCINLEQEKAKLLEQNAELSRKVAKFKEILSTRSKLTAFLKTLEEISC